MKMKTLKSAMSLAVLMAGAGYLGGANAATTTYTVTSLTAGSGTCDGSFNCTTLNAALTAANALPALPGDDIRIEFDAALAGDIIHNGATLRMHGTTLGSTVINDYFGFGAYLHVNTLRPVTIDFGNRVGAVQNDDAANAMLYIQSDNVVVENFQNDTMREVPGTGGYSDVAGIEGGEAAIVIAGSNVVIRNGLTSDPGTTAMETCIGLIDGASNITIEDYYCRSAFRFGLYVDERATVSNVTLNRWESQGIQDWADIWVEFGEAGETGDKTVVNGLTVTDSEFRSRRDQGVDYSIGFRESSIINSLMITGSRFLGSATPSIYAFPASGLGAVTIENNTATGTDFFFRTDVNVSHTGPVSISENVLNANSSDAILLQSPTSGTVIENNQLLNQSSAGLVSGVRIAAGAAGTDNVIRNNLFDQASPATDPAAPVNRFAIWMRANVAGGGSSGWSITNNTVRNIFGSDFGPIYNDGDGNTLISGNTFGEGTRGAAGADTAPENDDSFFVVNADSFSNGKIQTWRTTGATYSGSTITVQVSPVDPPLGGNTAPTTPVFIDVYHSATDKAETYLGRIPGAHTTETVFEFSSTAAGGVVRAQITDAAGRSSQYSGAQEVVQAVNGGADDDQDGLPNGAECTINLLGIPLTCEDSDADGTPDYQDPDDDNDGIPTQLECPDGSACVDTDGDATPNHLDLDSDGDGISDTEECPELACRDTDGDGISNYIDTDSDGDDIEDAAECPSGTSCLDSEGDGAADYLDTDDDGDSIPTLVECPTGTPCVDSDADGTPDRLDLDSDGDGVVDAEECPTQECRDTDQDAVPNYLDADSDGDGLTDAEECPTGVPCADEDDNGTADYVEPPRPPALEVRAFGGAMGPWLLMLLGGLATLRRKVGLPVAGVLAVLAPLAAPAATPEWSEQLTRNAAERFYGGVMAGGLFTNFDEKGLTRELKKKYVIDRVDSDSDNLGYGGWIGYGLTESLGLELSYTTGADERVRFVGLVGTDLQGALDTAEPYLTGYGDSYLARLRYYHPLSERWFFSPQLGLGMTQTRQTFTNGSETARLKKDSLTGELGAGIHYELNQDWSAGVVANYYQSSSENFYGVIAAALEWRFPRALAATQSASSSAVPVRVVPVDAVLLNTVYFAVNSAELTAEAQALLDQSLPALQGKTRIEVLGHTDATGSEVLNDPLSKARAQAVLDYLAAQGIEPAAMSATGHQALQPAASNDTDEGRALNRRVEIWVGNS